ncbi:MAG: aldo/keto reductase [Bdellovibrionales bacterium]|nr:aldo/keto reductase [Bdellovibrionales bacterium]
MMSLDSYRLLGRSGLRVSPLCLGTMTFGTAWGWGAEKDECRKITQHFLESGGNFIDTANYYTGGESESMLGEFLSGRRQEVVLATKYTLSMQPGNPNAGGNHRKCMVESIEASLKRLGTDYIDLYWLHIWEDLTPVDEIMRAFDDLVRAGKVLYIGISDAPAWRVSQANTLAELRGWSKFIALQIEYSLLERTPERDLIPMAIEMGLGVTPWSPLGSGILTGKYNDSASPEGSQRAAIMSDKLTERNINIAREVSHVAQDSGCTPAQVALRWNLNQQGVVSPIIGARTLKQLQDNIDCLKIQITPEQSAQLHDASAIKLGFPHDFTAKASIVERIRGGTKIEN